MDACTVLRHIAAGTEGTLDGNGTAVGAVISGQDYGTGHAADCRAGRPRIARISGVGDCAAVGAVLDTAVNDTGHTADISISAVAVGPDHVRYAAGIGTSDHVAAIIFSIIVGIGRTTCDTAQIDMFSSTGNLDIDIAVVLTIHDAILRHACGEGFLRTGIVECGQSADPQITGRRRGLNLEPAVVGTVGDMTVGNTAEIAEMQTGQGLGALCDCGLVDYLLEGTAEQHRVADIAGIDIGNAEITAFIKHKVGNLTTEVLDERLMSVGRPVLQFESLAVKNTVEYKGFFQRSSGKVDVVGNLDHLVCLVLVRILLEEGKIFGVGDFEDHIHNLRASGDVAEDKDVVALDLARCFSVEELDIGIHIGADRESGVGTGSHGCIVCGILGEAFLARYLDSCGFGSGSHGSVVRAHGHGHFSGKGAGAFGRNPDFLHTIDAHGELKQGEGVLEGRGCACIGEVRHGCKSFRVHVLGSGHGLVADIHLHDGRLVPGYCALERICGHETGRALGNGTPDFHVGAFDRHHSEFLGSFGCASKHGHLFTDFPDDLLAVLQ